MRSFDIVNDVTFIDFVCDDTAEDTWKSDSYDAHGNNFRPVTKNIAN